MKHFIITRFNIKSQNWQQTKSGKSTQSEAWMNQRFSLFERFCLPSVINQKEQNFKWLIVFDINTPKVYKNRIISIAQSYNNLIPLFTESFQTLKPTLLKAILTQLDSEDKFIITTRLDNDDAIHADFISSIQQQFVSQHNTIIDIVKGYQLIENKNKFDVCNYTAQYNPFISLIEDAVKFETVMSKNHDHWKTLHNRVVYSQKALWLQVIHSDNLLNSKIRSLKKVNQLDLNMFGLKNINIENHKLKIMIFNLSTIPIRLLEYLKINLKKLIK